MTGPNQTGTRGRSWAYIGALVGGLISIAANVAHSFVAPQGAPADWAPKPGAVIGSMFWPILLFVAVEILARVRWPKGFWWALLRFGGLIPVVAVAGLVSYRHLRGLLLYYGEDQIVAVLGPLAVDGLMVMATAALIVTSLHHTETAPAAPANAAPAEPANVVAPAAASTSVGTVVEGELPARNDRLLDKARFAVNAHRHRTGQEMTPEQLAAVMNMSELGAQELMHELDIENRQLAIVMAGR